MRLQTKLALLAVVALALPAAGIAAHYGASATTTLIYSGASDPTYLDPALVSDGESFRITKQIFEGLVELKPGTTLVVPALAKSWKPSAGGRVWTFQLRKGVKFHDGTAFNAAAVCFNFNRWYNFSGPFQDPGASYYWQQIFGGFSHNESSTLGASLYKSCRAKGSSTAVITLTKPSSAFISSLVISSFAMQSPAALQQYGADQGAIQGGVFHPTGTYAFQHPTGTGPYKFVSWTQKEKVVLARNDQYWGKKAKLQQVVVRPIADNTARVQALQNGEIQAMDLLQPQDIPTVQNNSKLKVLNRPPFNVGYVVINQSKPPTNNLLVRKAIAYGLDRAGVVNAFYAGRGIVANEFQPPNLWGWTNKVPTYNYDPNKAKQLLQQAGMTLPVTLDFWYPTNVSRPYMPDPKRNFEAFAASLEKSGFKIVTHSAPWRPDYVAKVNGGDAGNLSLIGWTGDFGDPDNFLGVFFKHYNAQFGFQNAKLSALLTKAATTTNFKMRVKLYQQANIMIMRDIVPGVPYVHSRPALAAESAVTGYVPSPVGTESFLGISFGGQ